MRSYDEDDERPVSRLVLTQVTRKTEKPTELEYRYDASGIEHFNPSLLVFQWALLDEKEWHIGTLGVSLELIQTRLVYDRYTTSNVVYVSAEKEGGNAK